MTFASVGVTAVQGSDVSRRHDDDTLAHKSGGGEAAALTTNNSAMPDESRGRRSPCSPSNGLEAWPPSVNAMTMGTITWAALSLHKSG